MAQFNNGYDEIRSTYFVLTVDCRRVSCYKLDVSIQVNNILHSQLIRKRNAMKTLLTTLFSFFSIALCFLSTQTVQTVKYTLTRVSVCTVFTYAFQLCMCHHQR